MNLGAHKSIAGGVDKALERGKETGCGAVQMFVKSSNQWKARPLREEEIAAFRRKKAGYRDDFLMAHSSYLINIASPESGQALKSINALVIEIKRCAVLDIPFLVLHPGSHRGTTEEEGIERIASRLSEVFLQTGGAKVMVLLETTSGTGDNIGYRFEHIAWIMDKVRETGRTGCCYDTCHSFAAGYDIRTRESYEKTFSEFDRVIGFENLKAFHLNDSLHGLGSRKDRHQHIGEGKIGKEGFSFLVNDQRFMEIPMVLETPKDGDDLEFDRKNLALLRSMRESERKQK
ncbi:MAG: deoxyribonuclease IV [Candidatus Krumholzibacteriales bacterium]